MPAAMLRLNVPLVLASRSPRRSALLKQIGLTFDVRPADTPEIWPEHASPGEAVEQIALEKVTATEAADALVLGADTVVVLDGDVLGKPDDAEHASSMLRRLSGRTHIVYTGVALRYGTRETTRHAATCVTFAEMADAEIAQYVAAAKPFDKAGAYGIQDDLGALLVARIDGEYTNVIGLPLRTLYEALRSDFSDLLL
ncbi:MAG: Maf family protein [Rubricoccaceae bacterium]